MDLSFLPCKISDAAYKLELDKLYEIRLRSGFPIKVCYDGDYTYLTNNGISKTSSEAILCTQNMIEEIVERVTEHSLYAFNDQLRKGYIDANNGIRIGVAGKCVFEDEQLITIKSYSSLNIRIPHQVFGCAKHILNKIIFNGDVLNSLIVSPPFFGKTTILKDIAVSLNEQQRGPILIIDERGEFNSITGENIDLIKYSDKLFAFNIGVRSMSPKIVITDEIVGSSDWNCVNSVVNSGVKIIASCHAKSMEDLKRKDGFLNNIFDRYVLLKNYFFNSNLVEFYNGEYLKL